MDVWTAHWVWDLLRLATATGALWLAALVLRLGWNRRHDPEDSEKPHPLVYASYGGALIFMAVERIPYWGQDPTWQLWPSMFVVIAGMIGVLSRVRISRVPPHRRH